MNSRHDNEICFKPDKSLLWFGVIVIFIFGIIQAYCIIENEVLSAVGFTCGTVAGIWFIGMWAKFRLVLGSQSVREQRFVSSEEVRWVDVECVSWRSGDYIILKIKKGQLRIVLVNYPKSAKPMIVEYVRQKTVGVPQEGWEEWPNDYYVRVSIAIMIFVVVGLVPYAFFLRSEPGLDSLFYTSIFKFVPYWCVIIFWGRKIMRWDGKEPQTRELTGRPLKIVQAVCTLLLFSFLIHSLPEGCSRSGEHKPSAIRQIAVFGTALDTFKYDMGTYPASLQELLVAPENSPHWQGPYLKGELQVDRWGHPYIYIFPGKRHPQSYDISSAGPDGKHGTKDDFSN